MKAHSAFERPQRAQSNRGLRGGQLPNTLEAPALAHTNALTGGPPVPYVSRSYPRVIAHGTLSAGVEPASFTPVLGKRAGIEPALPRDRKASPPALHGAGELETEWGAPVRGCPGGIFLGKPLTRVRYARTRRADTTYTRGDRVSPQFDRVSNGLYTLYWYKACIASKTHAVAVWRRTSSCTRC